MADVMVVRWGRQKVVLTVALLAASKVVLRAGDWAAWSAVHSAALKAVQWAVWMVAQKAGSLVALMAAKMAALKVACLAEN